MSSDDQAQQAPAAPDEEGVPGSEVVFAGGNVLGLALTALGGLWLWIAGGVIAAALGIAAWRGRRQRTVRQSTTRGTRSLGRTPSGGRLGGGTGRGGGRGLGRVLGRSGGQSGRSTGRTGRAAKGTGAAAAGRSGGRRGRGGVLSGAPGSRTGRRAGGGHAGAGGRGRTASGRRLLRPSTWFGSGRGRTGSSGGGRTGGRSGANTASGRKLTRPSTWLGRGRPGAGRTSHGARGNSGSAAARRQRRRSQHSPDPTRHPDTVLLPDNHNSDPQAPATAAPDAAERDPEPPLDTRPEPHPYRDQPEPTGTTRKDTLMAQFGRRWKDNAEEIAAKASGYDPEKMPDYLSDLQDLIEAFRTEASAVGKVAAVSEAELPVDPKLADYVREMQSLLLKVSEEAAEVVGHFRKLHEGDLNRHGAPRPGEKKWNV